MYSKPCRSSYIYAHEWRSCHLIVTICGTKIISLRLWAITFLNNWATFAPFKFFQCLPLKSLHTDHSKGHGRVVGIYPGLTLGEGDCCSLRQASGGGDRPRLARDGSHATPWRQCRIPNITELSLRRVSHSRTKEFRSINVQPSLSIKCNSKEQKKNTVNCTIAKYYYYFSINLII